MKKVLKIKKQHPASFRYYKIMKEVLSHGIEALAKEKESIEAELASLPKEGKEYAKARGMQNVLTQFEKIEIKKGEVVSSVVLFSHIVGVDRQQFRLCCKWETRCDSKVLCSLVWPLPSTCSDLCT